MSTNYDLQNVTALSQVLRYNKETEEVVIELVKFPPMPLHRVRTRVGRYCKSLGFCKMGICANMIDRMISENSSLLSWKGENLGKTMTVVVTDHVDLEAALDYIFAEMFSDRPVLMESAV